MNELRPFMCRSDPAGSGGAGCAGGGRRKVVRARATALDGPDSRWPISALAPAMPTATEPVIRNARRPGGDAGPAGRGGGSAGTQDAPVPGSGEPGGSPAVPGGGETDSARSVADAAFTSRDRV